MSPSLVHPCAAWNEGGCFIIRDEKKTADLFNDDEGSKGKATRDSCPERYTCYCSPVSEPPRVP